MTGTPEEVDHHERLRCPACGRTWRVDADSEGYDIYEEGDHDVCCPGCEHEFWVRTAVECTFTSPPLEQETTDAQEA